MQSKSPSAAPARIPSGAPSRRRHRRNPVLVNVRWHNRLEEGVSAEIHDVSPEGLFLVPDTALSSQVSIGDPVWVVVPGPSGAHETLTGIVRWHGFHPAHKAPGCGILLDPPSLAIIARLFPDLPEPE